MKLNKLGTIAGIMAAVLAGIGSLYAMDRLPVTGSALAESETRQATRDENQDKLFILSQIRTLNGDISNVKYDLQVDPQNQFLLRELDDLKLEISLLRDELNALIEGD